MNFEQIMKNAGRLVVFASVAVMALVAAPAIAAQMNTAAVATTETKEQVKPSTLVDNLKGIRIGMTADEVKDALGKPEVSDEKGMYFDLKNDESMQLRIDKAKKVTMIAVMYAAKADRAPEAADIFGPDVAVTPQKNGNLYKRVRDKAGHYSVTYSRINLDKGHMTTITMQKAN